MASKPRDRVGHGKACMRCKRQRTKCSDRSKLTGKCQHCERLGYECEDQFQGGESGESGSTPVEESPSLAYTASPYGTISGEPSNQNLAPPRRIPDALRKIPDFGMAVTDEEHDQALDRGLEWVVRELGRSFNEDAFWAAAMVEVDYPSVRVLHWSLILKGFLIQGDLSVEVAGELSLFVWLALFKDFQSNAAWAYHARVILWDHLSTVGDNRSGLVGGVSPLFARSISLLYRSFITFLDFPAIMSVAPTVS
ncbi:uncharacterized protein EI90DRAFT_3285097, partial [Cantharellus anzutake]|uniref:uncharacterized protein n=1 Tax=Cantharellus anzutake TaxID=1750568 RepID=UPI0019034049